MTFDNFAIRPITSDDAVKFYKLVENNRQRISTYFPGIVGVTKTLEETTSHIAERIAEAENGKYMIYLIVECITNNFVGVVQLKDIDFNARKREFGFFVDSHYENKGIATKKYSISL